MVSQTAEYALRAVAWLAVHPGLATAEAIAEQTRVPARYMAKVLGTLARAGIVAGRRGVGGGFRLARDPAQLTLLDVVAAVEPIQRITTCPLGLPLHQGELCRLHARLDAALAALERELAGATIEQLFAGGGPLAPLCLGAMPGEKPPGPGQRTRHDDEHPDRGSTREPDA